MAEIKIEKKKPVWPWVLLVLLIVGGLVYYFMNKDKDNVKEDQITHTKENDLIGVKENNRTVLAYISFINENRENMDISHEYSKDALIKLAEATKAMADEVGHNVREDLGKVKEYADMITNNSDATTHADYIKKSSEILSDALENLQQSKYPTLASDAKGVKAASQAINPDVLTLDQKEVVKNFYHRAADLLEKMN